MSPIEAYLVLKAFAKVSNISVNTAVKHCEKMAPTYLASMGLTEQEVVDSLSNEMVNKAFENNMNAARNMFKK